MKKAILFCMTFCCCMACNKYPLEIGTPPTLVFVDEATKNDTIIVRYNDYYNDMIPQVYYAKKTGNQAPTLPPSTNL